MSNDSLPSLTVSENALEESGFITSGKDHYKKVVNSYAEELFFKSIAYAEGDRASNLKREVTHEHIKKAYFSIVNSGLNRKDPIWTLLCQIFEYIIMAMVGVCGSYIDKSWAQLGFGIGLFTVTMLILARNVLGRETK